MRMTVCFLCDDLTRHTGTGACGVELIGRLQARATTCKVFCSARTPASERAGITPRAVLTSWLNGYRKPLRVVRAARAVVEPCAKPADEVLRR